MRKNFIERQTFCFKRCFKYRGSFKKVIEKFWDLKFILNDIFMIFKISGLEGWGIQSAENLRIQLKNQKK